MRAAIVGWQDGRGNRRIRNAAGALSGNDNLRDKGKAD